VAGWFIAILLFEQRADFLPHFIICLLRFLDQILQQHCSDAGGVLRRVLCGLHQVGEGISADEAVGDEVDQFEDGCARFAVAVIAVVFANLPCIGLVVDGLGIGDIVWRDFRSLSFARTIILRLLLLS
jgi:hypothetical protein